MSLTSKQIEELRAYAADRKGELAKLINDAADTIELLSAKLHASQVARDIATIIENEKDMRVILDNTEPFGQVTSKLEPCADAVSRADVINFLCDWICAPGERCVSDCKCLKGIRELPSITHKLSECEDAVSRTDMLTELDGWIEDLYGSGHKESYSDMKLIRKSMMELPPVTPKLPECEDAVSRQSILEWIEECLNHADKLWEYEEKALINVKKYLEKLPPVTPKLSNDTLDDAYAHGHTEAEAKFYQWREEHECEDAVSRTAVMDILYLDPGITVEQEKMIKQLPFVMPKPKIGE